jgi:hypothetical protein
MQSSNFQQVIVHISILYEVSLKSKIAREWENGNTKNKRPWGQVFNCEFTKRWRKGTGKDFILKKRLMQSSNFQQVIVHISILYEVSLEKQDCQRTGERKYKE